jgi:hypothetical protein
MPKTSSFRNTLVQLASFLLWVISAVVGVVTAFTIRAALMAFYTDVLTNFINPWSIHSMYQFTAFVVILAWLVLTMMGYAYYADATRVDARSFDYTQEDKTLERPIKPLLHRFAIVTVPQVLVVGLGYLMDLIP